MNNFLLNFFRKMLVLNIFYTKRKNDFAESVIDTPITTLDFELLNQ